MIQTGPRPCQALPGPGSMPEVQMEEALRTMETSSHRNGHLQGSSSLTEDPSPALCFPHQLLGDEGEDWRRGS